MLLFWLQIVVSCDRYKKNLSCDRCQKIWWSFFCSKCSSWAEDFITPIHFPGYFDVVIFDMKWQVLSAKDWLQRCWSIAHSGRPCWSSYFFSHSFCRWTPVFRKLQIYAWHFQLLAALLLFFERLSSRRKDFTSALNQSLAIGGLVIYHTICLSQTYHQRLCWIYESPCLSAILKPCKHHSYF